MLVFLRPDAKHPADVLITHVLMVDDFLKVFTEVCNTAGLVSVGSFTDFLVKVTADRLIYDYTAVLQTSSKKFTYTNKANKHSAGALDRLSNIFEVDSVIGDADYIEIRATEGFLQMNVGSDKPPPGYPHNGRPWHQTGLIGSRKG